MRDLVCDEGDVGVRDERLRCLANGLLSSTPQRLVHDQLCALVSAHGFPCLGGRAAVNRGTYRFAMYEELGTLASARRLGNDLCAFMTAVPSLGELTTFMACFSEPTSAGEEEFESRLWIQLQALHDLDAAAWDPEVSPDPGDPRFSFSFGGRAFFVVGLHAGSSRWSRRFAWPTLIFNLKSQFDRLRGTHRFSRFQRVIRVREMALQGGLPNLEESDACQYAGRATDRSWRCPLRVRSRAFEGTTHRATL